jgi:hypothetical protein
MSMPHDELEQLSAFIDGELNDSDRERLEAHVATCRGCTEVLTALRATVADLAALPSPEPSEQDSWALRSSIATARVPRRARAPLIAMGSAAAALVAALAVSLSGGGGAQNSTGPVAAPDLAAAVRTGDYDAATVRARTVALAQGAPEPQKRTKTSAQGSGASDAEKANVQSAPLAGGSFSTADSAENADQRCVATARGSKTYDLIALDRIRFRGREAYLVAFRAPDHVEVWILARASCDLLLFEQART